jgi:hypothetical protein
LGKAESRRYLVIARNEAIQNYRITGEAGFTGFFRIASFLAMTNALYVNVFVMKRLSEKRHW